jgi:methylated-DNA-[protein]-cysteine S-methyltransferase
MNIEQDLARAYPDDPDTLRRLHERLATAAANQGVLDIAYRTIDSPVGQLLLAATDRGLVRVAFATEGHDAVLRRLRELSPAVGSAHAGGERQGPQG